MLGLNPSIKRVVKKEIGQQRANHSSYAKTNFQFERVVTGWRGTPILDLRLRGNILMTHGQVHQSKQGTTVECRLSSAPKQHGAARSGAEPITRVWSVTAPSLPISRTSSRTWPPGSHRGSLDTHHAEASAEHRAPAALVCVPKRADDRRDRYTCTENVSERATKAWLTGGQDVSRLKSIWTIHLIACSRPSWHRSMSFWYPCNSAWSA